MINMISRFLFRVPGGGGAPFTLRRNTFEGEAHLFCLRYIDFEMPVKHPRKNV